MNEQVFDAMLRTALEEALEEDVREAEASLPAAPRPSARQRRRMRKMLADPWRYERRSRSAEPPKEEAPRRTHTPRQVRWGVVAAVIVLLTGTAAGYALQGGAFFRSFFDQSAWAEDYRGAADTEQVLKMGGTGVGAVAEDENFRIELLDAISEGETAMAAVKITVKNPDLLAQAAGEDGSGYGYFLHMGGSFFERGSSQTSYIYPDADRDLEENQMLLIFRTSGNQVNAGKSVSIDFCDYGYERYTGKEQEIRNEIVLVPGVWTLRMELDFDGGILLEKHETVALEQVEITVNSVRVTALSVGVNFRCPQDSFEDVCEALHGAVIRMQNGTEIPYSGFTLCGSDEDCEALYEFELPVDREEIAALVVDGQEISLR